MSDNIRALVKEDIAALTVEDTTDDEAVREDAEFVDDERGFRFHGLRAGVRGRHLRRWRSNAR